MLDRQPIAPDSQIVECSYLLTRSAGDKSLFVSRSNQPKLQVTRHRCSTTLFAMAQAAEMDGADVLHVNEMTILIFHFFDDDAQLF